MLARCRVSAAVVLAVVVLSLDPRRSRSPHPRVWIPSEVSILLPSVCRRYVRSEDRASFTRPSLPSPSRCSPSRTPLPNRPCVLSRRSGVSVHVVAPSSSPSSSRLLFPSSSWRIRILAVMLRLEQLHELLGVKPPPVALVPVVVLALVTVSAVSLLLSTSLPSTSLRGLRPS